MLAGPGGRDFGDRREVREAEKELRQVALEWKWMEA